VLTVVYSFNKRGYEARVWAREIAAASNERVRFVPFNHEPYLDPQRYLRAQLLDNLYHARDPGLQRLYRDFERVLADHRAQVVIVDNCPPYHPDYLRTLDVYRALRIADGPIAAYDRDFAYVHAYDHVLYHGPAYSRDMDMAEKLRYCGVRNADLWKLALFDAAFDVTRTEATLFAQPRDVEVIFIGALHPNKMPLLAKVKKAFGARCRLYGLSSLKRAGYFNLKYGFPGWVRPVPFEAYVPLYQRSRIGFNVHNRGKYTVGSYRLFDLPGNGVMQISDGGEHLDAFFRVGQEIVGYEDADDLVDKIGYYLAHEDERRAIARNGYRRVMRDHRFRLRMGELEPLLARGMARREGS
jgi:spore maturation protein CgeB